MKDYNFDGKTILIVDDDAISVRVAKSCLQRTGADVISTDNGEDAVKLVSDRHIDLILMDIRMPVMDGYDATTKIRKFDKKVSIIAYTALNPTEEREKCLQSEFNDYLAKPVHPEVMLDTINKHLD